MLLHVTITCALWVIYIQYIQYICALELLHNGMRLRISVWLWVQWRHIGSFKLAMGDVFTPGKLTDTKNQGFFSQRSSR